MTIDSQPSRSAGQAAWRFLLIGGSNTLITAAVLVGLSYVMPGWLAYSISFALGLVFSTVFAARWVFTSAGSTAGAMVYAACYLGVFLAGLLVVAGIRALEWPEYANAASVLVTAPLGFVIGRIVFREREEKSR